MEVDKNQRLREFVNYQIRERKIKNDTDFAKKIGSPRSVVSDFLCAKRKITDKTILKIKWAFPELNEKWLKTGEGEMLVGGNEKTYPIPEEHSETVEEPHVMKSSDLLAAPGDLRKAFGYRSVIDIPMENPNAVTVTEEQFLDVCAENVGLRKENLNLRKRLFALMERMAKEGLPCDDEIC